MNNRKHTALITGASEGIGMELARIHASKGDHLVLVARRGDRLEALKKELEEQFGIQVMVIAKNLSLANSPQEVFEATQKANLAIDILVNNAGFGHFDLFTDSPWEKEDRMIQLNIAALTHLTKLYLPGMISGGYGRILNVSSVASFIPGPYMSVYFATKAFVTSFSEALAAELQGTGVTVTNLCPGATRSGFQAAAEVREDKPGKGDRMPSGAEVAAFGYRAMMLGRTTVVHGWKNRLMIRFSRLLSGRQAASVIRRMQTKG
ncbi:MAG TPA: SDR family oxidoreductase [Bacteroidales bacterium]|nr:SDR family oxidoreductase [Bacteroidales bacterium]